MGPGISAGSPGLVAGYFEAVGFAIERARVLGVRGLSLGHEREGREENWAERWHECRACTIRGPRSSPLRLQRAISPSVAHRGSGLSSAAMGRVLLRGMLWLVGGLAPSACFTSEFILYGPVCVSAQDCDDVVGDGDARRACFAPDPEAGAGYCADICSKEQPACAASDALEPVCIERPRDNAESLWVCAIACEDTADCPGQMRCDLDPLGKAGKLCIPE